MLYPSDLIEEIRAENDIVSVISEYITLKQKGSNYFGLCPFHNEHTPSFSVSADKQLYHCFGCGESGNVFGFVMAMENLDFPESVKFLARRAGITLPEPQYSREIAQQAHLKERLYALHKDAARFFYSCLSTPDGQTAVSYMDKRQIDPRIRKKFGLGYSPKGRGTLYAHLKKKGYSDREITASGLCFPAKNGGGFIDKFYNRLMFPIFDLRMNLCGFGGRSLDGKEPKYLNSPETPIFSKSRILYGLNFAKAERKDELILVEGYMDMISLYQAGFKNTAALLGTAFNTEHTKTLKRITSSIVLLYDSDEPGTKAALRAIPILTKEGFSVKAVQVPDGKDPDEFIKQHGSAEFAKLIASADNPISFQIEILKRKYNLENPEHKMLFLKEAADLIANLESSMEAEIYVSEAAKATGVSPESFFAEVKKIKAEKDKKARQELRKKQIRNYNSTTPAEYKAQTKGVLKAAGELLSMCAADKKIYEIVSRYLEPSDFPNEALAELADIIYTKKSQNENIFPGELLNSFTEPELQRQAAAVFANEPAFDSHEQKEKALTEEIKQLKSLSLKRKLRSVDSIEALQEINSALKALETLSIDLQNS
ncbi:MAG: DNA primase [Firmicutes bacterium]|nr:DNA primase [Bacillota bacterium]